MAEFECGICNQSFPSRNKLFIHIRNSHDTQRSSDSTLKIETSSTKNVAEIDIPVVYEDSECRIFCKPQGLPTMGCKEKSLMKNPCVLIKENFASGVKYRKAVPCHRLDSATGGILICSKTKEAETLIRYCFREKLVQKRYLAIVVGKLESSEGIIESKISGKPAKTLFKVHSCTSTPHKCQYLTTVSLWPITGRRHQLRRQLSELGCPIMGDRRYSFANQWVDPQDRLYLWAVELWLPHPKELSLIGMEKLIHRHNLPTASSSSSHKRKKIEDDEEENSDSDDEETNIELPDRKSTIQTAAIIPMKVNVDEYFTKSLISYELNKPHILDNILHITIQEPEYYREFCSLQQALYETPNM